MNIVFRKCSRSGSFNTLIDIAIGENVNTRIFLLDICLIESQDYFKSASIYRTHVKRMLVVLV